MTDAPSTATLEPAEPQPAPSPSGLPAPSGDSLILGTGRRKRSVARVRVRAGEGRFIVNDRPVEEYFHLEKDRHAARLPLQVTETARSVDVFVNVIGGGPSGQAGAVLLGLARALARMDPQYNVRLREQQLLKRDPRKVERKKYGQRGARRRFQFSKR